MKAEHLGSSFRTVLGQTVAWLRRRDMAAMVLLLIAVAGTWAFVELADEVLEGETRAFDRAVLEWFRMPDDLAQPRGPAWLLEAMRDVTALGSMTVLMLLIAAVTGFCLLAGNRQAMGIVLAASIGGLAASSLLKSLLQRERPAVVPHLTEVMTWSFPSGHSMMSATIYLTLGLLLARLVDRRRLKSYFIAVAISVTLLVGLSRVYLGVHYPTDVLAGWTAGAVWAVFSGLVLNWLFPRPKPLVPESPEESPS